ncbi:MAG: GNAT family N-acetyltransferase [Actinomycetes bacterium]
MSTTVPHSENDYVHPTKRLLFEVTMDLLEVHDFADVSLEMVLTASGISKGSIYYHFEDFPDLLEQSIVALLQEKFLLPLAELVNVFRAANSPTEVVQAIHEKIDGRQVSDVFSKHLMTAKYLSTISPRMRDRRNLLLEQELNEWTSIVDICDAKGWSNSAMESRTVALLLQSVSTFEKKPEQRAGKAEESHQFKALSFLFQTTLFDTFSFRQDEEGQAKSYKDYFLDTSDGFDLSLLTERYLKAIYAQYRIEKLEGAQAMEVRALHMASSDNPRYLDGNLTENVQQLLPRLFSANTETYGAYKDNRLVGFLTGELKLDYFEFHVCNIDREFRNKGLSSALVAYAVLEKTTDGITSFVSPEREHVPGRLDVMTSLGFKLA